jgi:hypothetical protein
LPLVNLCLGETASERGDILYNLTVVVVFREVLAGLRSIGNE